MEIFAVNKTRSEIDLLKLRLKILELFRIFEKDHKMDFKKKELSIAMIGDRVMAEINYRYRHQNKPTDVLSFSGDNDLLGEIIICYPQIKRQAKEHGAKAEDELLFITIHGLLHLLGYNDENDHSRKKMIALGKKYFLSLMNYDYDKI
jgi:probable rRNA maturation factor